MTHPGFDFWLVSVRLRRLTTDRWLFIYVNWTKGTVQIQFFDPFLFSSFQVSQRHRQKIWRSIKKFRNFKISPATPKMKKDFKSSLPEEKTKYLLRSLYLPHTLSLSSFIFFFFFSPSLFDLLAVKRADEKRIGSSWLWIYAVVEKGIQSWSYPNRNRRYFGSPSSCGVNLVKNW